MSKFAHVTFLRLDRQIAGKDSFLVSQGFSNELKQKLSGGCWVLEDLVS